MQGSAHRNFLYEFDVLTDSVGCVQVDSAFPGLEFTLKQVFEEAELID